jgi:hypothetical protein
LNIPFQCIPERVGLAATAWGIFAQREINPLDPLGPHNKIPVANAGLPQAIPLGDTVTLDGTASADPDAGPSPLIYQWTQAGGPAVGLDGAAAATPRFTPVLPGAYEFSLVVSDGAASSPAATVSVEVIDAPVAALAPNGGEVWKAGTVQTIRWYASSALADLSRPAKIKFSKNGGKTWKKLKKAPAAGGMLAFKFKPGQAGASARIEVCVAPKGKKAKPVCDASDADFSVVR